MKCVRWSQEDVEFLQNYWGTKDIKVLARRLNRTITAIRNKAVRLNLGPILESKEDITFSRLFETIYGHRSYAWAMERFVKAGLKVKRKKIVNAKVWMVDIKDFWSWAEENKNLLNFAKFEKNTLGLEPDWVDEKRKADMRSPSKTKRNIPWSKDEISKMIFMVNAQRYNYADISKEINRSQAAIKRKLYDLNIKARPIPLSNTVDWTQEEKLKLQALAKKGFDSYTLALILNKSEHSICDKIKETSKQQTSTKITF